MRLPSRGVAATLKEREEDSDRQARMARILELKLQLLCNLDPGVERTFITPTRLFLTLAGRVEAWPETKRDALLIEVAFASPFAPYEVRITEKQYNEALRVLATGIGLSGRRADEVVAAIASARRAHHHIEWVSRSRWRGNGRWHGSAHDDGCRRRCRGTRRSDCFVERRIRCRRHGTGQAAGELSRDPVARSLCASTSRHR